MALTPEDIVNKRFQSTKFREGYDQDEVDDFLDEVVAEMRRVVAENEELSQKLAATDGRISELQRGGPAPSVATPPIATSDDVVDTENANNLLQLARRLHEEHVREGIQKRDELIAEGHAQAARIVAEAEAEHQVTVAKLEQERATMSASVEELRAFEREYRQSLKNFITGQVNALDASLEVASSPAGAPTTAPPVTDPASASDSPDSQ
ncbi:DivIVA domain-containing protein [Pontimonas sp.]|nr:DivIVA domain-containing protein [Pontimonas sp.]